MDFRFVAIFLAIFWLANVRSQDNTRNNQLPFQSSASDFFQSDFSSLDNEQNYKAPLGRPATGSADDFKFPVKPPKVEDKFEYKFPFPTYKWTDRLPPVSIPAVRDACVMNYTLLNRQLIKETREDIRDCDDNYESCYHEENSKYRTIDGSCNNLKHPSWGKADLCLRRILPYDYSDGVSFPRKSCTGKELPNARHVSNVFHQETKIKNDKFTAHFMSWGQVLAHDFSLNDIFRAPPDGQEAIICCLPNETVDDRCISFNVPKNDPFYPKVGVTCINIIRTQPCPHCKSGVRQHWNQNTAYIDLSLVYGSDEKTARGLRSGQYGMLKINYTEKAGPLLPAVQREELCVSPSLNKSCYHSGDFRTNQNPFILTFHTILTRYHNFLCHELLKVNPHWGDEKLYQEARRIFIAQAQFITYGHYLPRVLGVVMDEDHLSVLPGDHYTEYNPKLDATIDDEFTNVAARYGHTLIPNSLSEIDTHSGKKGSVRVKNYFYFPFNFPQGQMDRFALGMAKDPERKHDVFLADDVRNHLYRRVYLNETGLDLAAISIARGRDHGIPGYAYYLAYFFNFTVTSFDDLKKVMPERSVYLLQQLYRSVYDVDIYSAGFAEYHVKGGIVGPTFSTILGRQYYRLKYGDRYYFEHRNQAGSFTKEQLREIKKTTFARMLCEVTTITKIQRDVFSLPSISNPIVPCERIYKFNVKLWQE